jgi:hypothetical protein
MLSDFRELKTKLSLIEKSNATLGKPLRFYPALADVRDTFVC